MTHDCSQPLAEHAFGTLDAREAARVDAHLAACAACRVEFDEFVAALERFGLCTDVHGRKGPGGTPIHVARAVFDYFDADGSGVRTHHSERARVALPIATKPVL